MWTPDLSDRNDPRRRETSLLEEGGGVEIALWLSGHHLPFCDACLCFCPALRPSYFWGAASGSPSPRALLTQLDWQKQGGHRRPLLLLGREFRIVQVVGWKRCASPQSSWPKSPSPSQLQPSPREEKPLRTLFVSSGSPSSGWDLAHTPIFVPLPTQ